jgi:hypothetical protein
MADPKLMRLIVQLEESREFLRTVYLSGHLNKSVQDELSSSVKLLEETISILKPPGDYCPACGRSY